MRRAIVAFACAVLVAALPAPARAADNGQLAAVAGGRLVAVNADGSGLRTLWAPTSDITGLTWSPDGNKLAFSYARKITVFDLEAKSVTSLTNPVGNERDVDPTWSASGQRIAFRRIGELTQRRMRIALDGSVVNEKLPEPITDALAIATDLETHAFTLGTFLFWSGRDLELTATATGTPAWAPIENDRLAYVDTGSQFPPRAPGLYVYSVIAGTHTPVAPAPAAVPRWAPDRTRLVYASDGTLRTVMPGSPPSGAIAGLTNVTSADWQPCVQEVTRIGCRSTLPPACTAFTTQVTTQADAPVALPPAPCSDPASLPLSFVLVKGPDSGTLNGTVYTPNPGFIGQDSVTYKLSNGSSASDPIKATIFVVPRPAGTGPPPATQTPSNLAPAPFLSLRLKPRLDRKRTTIARLTCDQACAFTVRLEGTLRRGAKKAKTFKGKALTRTLEPGRVLALKLKLPATPKGKLRAIWITGTVRGANGVSRSVKLPVSPPG